MAFGYMRFGWALAGIIATMAVTAPSYASTDQTYATSDPGWGNVMVVSYSDYDRAFGVAPLALFKEQPPAVTRRGYQAYIPMTVKQRASGAAVLATTQAGWRSGRLRKLSVG